jgi:hypothetical protein
LATGGSGRCWAGRGGASTASTSGGYGCSKG